jgi:hypothetical protein
VSLCLCVSVSLCLCVSVSMCLCVYAEYDEESDASVSIMNIETKIE